MLTICPVLSAGAFNRTFKELKYQYGVVAVVQEALLIAPLRNGNKMWSILAKHLKAPFNRTFKELKFCKVTKDVIFYVKLLIAPLRNGNNTTVVPVPPPSTLLIAPLRNGNSEIHL